MYATLTTLIDRLDGPAVAGTDVIRWSSPVLSFGDLSKSVVATVGLNPSNREFVDDGGEELEGAFRRFHTLNSLGLTSWSEADARHLSLILESCCKYFVTNPYDRWFKRLDHVISGINASFYDMSSAACHLDLIPYATARKWTELSGKQRTSLLSLCVDSLALLLRDSSVEIVILNGQSVVDRFESIAKTCLRRELMPDWSLGRQAMPSVMGIGYSGMVDSLAGIKLSREILVLGYNHNLQSSFGVTTYVVNAIRSWIAKKACMGAR